MKRYTYSSALSADEVWYRLNYLLKLRRTWGSKGYELEGILKKDVCCLKIFGGGMGTLLQRPLRLWTEDAESGCTVVCSFGTDRGLWLLVLLASGVPGALLGLFLAIRSGDFYGLMRPALLIGVMLLFFWPLIPLELIRRGERKRDLLAWVRAHLLQEELFDVLLPPLGEQIRQWPDAE